MRFLAFASLLLLATVHSAAAQSVIEQSLPPPPGTTAAAPAPSVLAPRPKPPPRHVPVVRPAHAAVRKPPAKAATKPVARAPAKPAKPAAPSTPPSAPAKTAAGKFDPTKGTTTGLPLPRWASLRSDDVNLRSGPGTQYPIDWVYHRRDLPVQILREFEVWRLVQEQDGTKGWVHEATLAGRRGFVVQGGEQILRGGASDLDAPVARVQTGVVGHVDRCPTGSDWCAVQAGDYHGWLKREALYGVTATESIP